MIENGSGNKNIPTRAAIAVLGANGLLETK